MSERARYLGDLRALAYHCGVVDKPAERARLADGMALILRGLALAGPRVTWCFFRGRPVIAHPDHVPLVLCDDGTVQPLVFDSPFPEA